MIKKSKQSNQKRILPGNGAILTCRFRASLKHKDDGQTIYKTKLTKIRYNNQVLGKYRVDPHKAGLTLRAELTWSNLGLKEV